MSRAESHRGAMGDARVSRSHGITDWRAGEFGPDHVPAYKFMARSKAGLGSRFITVIESGCFKY